jgi:hypothetical protein
MNRVLSGLLVTLVFVGVASAQTIHQYPYDSTVTSYSSPSSWPLISGQCHWRPANNNTDTTNTPQLMSPKTGHTHIELNVPIYGEITGDIIVPFTIMMFQVDGYIDGLESPYSEYNNISDIVYDNNPGQYLLGDPNGLKVWTGHFTMHFGPFHGWVKQPIGVHTYFFSSDQTRNRLAIPLYILTDPSLPEYVSDTPSEDKQTNIRCNGGSQRDPAGTGIFGVNIVQYNAYMPILAPIKTAIPESIPFSYNYGGAFLFAPGTAMTRFDMDLHHGVSGTFIQSQMVNQGDLSTLSSPFDPTILGPGTHKVAAIWQQDTGAGIPGSTTPNEQMSALLVVSVTVGDTPPPPIPVWQTLTGIFQHQVSPDPTQYQFCDTNGMNCQPFIRKP